MNKLEQATYIFRKHIADECRNYLEVPGIAQIITCITTYMHASEIHAYRGEHHDYVKNMYKLLTLIDDLSDNYPTLYKKISTDLQSYVDVVNTYERRSQWY